MGKLVYFCAGIDRNRLPSNKVKALLLNVPRNGYNERAIRRSQKLIKECKAGVVMLDSGGYQLLKSSQNGRRVIYDENGPIWGEGWINLTPQHVIEAALKIKPDILVALDFPIETIKDRNKQEIEFRKKLRYNVLWAIETAELHKKYCPEIKLFVPVQCYSLEQLDIFLRKIKEVQFDGFSMPVRNLSLSEITSFLINFYGLGMRRVHLLGTLSIKVLALCAYGARHLFDWVSLDATSWTTAAQYNEYMRPENLKRISLNDGKLKIAQCACPQCRGKPISLIKTFSPRKRRALLMGHNYWCVKKITADLFRNSKDLRGMQRFLERREVDSQVIDEISASLKLVDDFLKKTRS